MSATNIILERETANDETAVVVTIFAIAGKPVEKDELVFEIENSKAVQELRAPEAGILTHYLEVGQVVDFGVPIAQIVSEDAWAQIVAEVEEAPRTKRAEAPPEQAASSTETTSATGIEIMLERETANDESALVVATPVLSGTAVKKDELLFEIENSKAVQELCAPEDGILVHALSVGQTVDFGVPIATIVPAESWTARSAGLTRAQEELPPSSRPVSVPNSPSKGAVAPVASLPKAVQSQAKPTFSHAAAALIAQHGLDRSLFAASFVTSEAVRAYLAPSARPVRTEVAAPREERVRPAVPGARTGQAVGRSKRSEIEVLSKGAGETMLSVLGVGLGALSLCRQPGDFLDGRITDLVIYEASRLMKKFPKLNAYYADGQIFLHDAVHAGLAIDSGGRLVVYGIENTDRADLHELADTIALAVERYLADELTGAEMSRATFTVTDLSADRLDFVLPLLPRGQSCILAITHSPRAGFQVFAGFDHRITEGREVAAFLSELQDRLQDFASPDTPERKDARCVYCERTVSEAVSKGREKGLLRTIDREGHEVLCCGSCWNGW